VPNGALDVYTVKAVEPPHRGIVTVNVDERRDARPRLPAHLVAFSDSGGGDFCCFDTSALRDGECPIVWWDHESDEDQEPELAAPSFLDWIDSESCANARAKSKGRCSTASDTCIVRGCGSGSKKKSEVQPAGAGSPDKA
jgi:hypothetical protein